MGALTLVLSIGRKTSSSICLFTPISVFSFVFDLPAVQYEVPVSEAVPLRITECFFFFFLCCLEEQHKCIHCVFQTLCCFSFTKVTTEKEFESSWVVGPHFLSLLLPAGFLLFKDFCMNEIDEAVPQLKFYEEVSMQGLFLRPPGTLIPLCSFRLGVAREQLKCVFSAALTSPLHVVSVPD